ncbi:MAG: isoprenyl transferase [Coriobacteriia bacterium]|nr:isoprenyl transferase [Coriobacteriia bacterium]MCL2537784.1 isoprenyl transferase [Coriobacteriia bacterium]
MNPTASQLEWFESDHARARLEALDAQSLPQHIAIIMDGNGRWARAKGKPRLFGHKAGVKSVREMIASCVELGTGYLTIYSFSSENWTRPEEEVSGIMKLFVEVLSREVVNLNKQNVRVKLIGDLDDLPQSTREAFDNCVASTAENTGLTLVVALNYGARQDLVHATEAIAADIKAGSLTPEDITAQLISDRLSTAGIPDPDFLIRTSGETRLSNFLLYETAYTELYFTDILWPDFGRDQLLDALLSFQTRDRRYGGL